MKILQLTLLLVAVICIMVFSDSLLWRIAYLIGAVILVPGVTWFMEGSLRRANSHIIPEDREITIQVRNLVKSYGRPSEFKLEWISGQRIRERLGLKEDYRNWKDLRLLVWLVPLAVFFFYFVY